MKIGIVSNLYPPYARGGAEHVVVRTVEQLMERQTDIFIISAGPKDRGPGIWREHNATERIYRFFPRNLYFVLDDYKNIWLRRFFWHVIDAFSSSGANAVGEIVDEERPDIIVTHNLKGIGLTIPRAIQRRGITHVHVVHDLQLIYPSGLVFAGKEKEFILFRPIYAAYRWICKMRLGKPDLVIFPSKYLKDEYLKHGFFKNTEIQVMPNPAPRMQVEERPERSPGSLRLLFVGQLESHKGIQFLLDEFLKLDIDAKLIIAGEGTYAEQVKKAAEKDKRIVYLGYVSLEQLTSCFGIADALVVPSLCYENSPTVIYESLKAGVPVVASNIGGVGELVQDGVNGFLFTPGSKSDLIRTLWKLDGQKKEFSKKRAIIRETVAPYALDIYTGKLLEMLQRKVDAKKK